MGHVYPYWQIMLTKLPDYYFSFMKLIVSTFLVYKVKKCLLKSGKVNPRLCPTLPKALGIYARNCRLSVPAFSGVGAHVRGHESSCTRANYASLGITMFFPFG